MTDSSASLKDADPRPADRVRLTIIMAAYNESATIDEAVRRVLRTQYPCPVELIVVDDGSADGTSDHVTRVKDQRLTLVRHPRNLGKGAALMSGLAVATGTHVLPFDADLEYSPQDIARVLEPVMDGTADVVYGTRLFGLNTRYHSFRYKLGNRMTTLAANLLFDAAVTDLHTCFKLVPTDVLRRMPLTELGFGLDTEITAHVLKLGLRPFEVPIAYYARSHAQGKKINWKDGVRCLAVLTKVRLQPARLNPVPPQRGPGCEHCGSVTSRTSELTDARLQSTPGVTLPLQGTVDIVDVRSTP